MVVPDADGTDASPHFDKYHAAVYLQGFSRERAPGFYKLLLPAGKRRPGYPCGYERHRGEEAAALSVPDGVLPLCSRSTSLR